MSQDNAIIIRTEVGTVVIDFDKLVRNKSDVLGNELWLYKQGIFICAFKEFVKLKFDSKTKYSGKKYYTVERKMDV